MEVNLDPYSDGKAHGRADAYVIVLSLLDEGLEGKELRDRIQTLHDEAEEVAVRAAVIEYEQRRTSN